MKSRLLLFMLLSTCFAFGQFEKAQWITPGFAEDNELRPCPVFKKTFSTAKTVQSARLYITAHGLYEATINGARVGDAYFTPGWTSYYKRLQYQVYDVKDLFKKGGNEINVTIGEGWWRGQLGGGMNRDNYGGDAAALVALNIIFSDGSKQQIVSDNSWKSSTGPILHSDIYGGELYDAKVQIIKWTGVSTGNFSKQNLIVSECEPVKKQETFQTVKIITTPKKEQVIDFGQNISGWVNFRVRGKPGDTIRLMHAEVLDKDGNFFTGNLREAKATDIYILKGDKEETFEPHFTYHGFRYVKVDGCTVKPENFTAIALHSALEHTGSFQCSSKLINQLQSNIEWSLNDNFFDVPTDCPQRSERLGWTGDAQVFCRTASFNRNVNLFFTKWLRDLRADQGSNGAVPNIIPDLYGHLNEGAKNGIAGWSDAATVVPWTMYWVYADTSLLNEQYLSMKAWVDYIQTVSRNFLWEANGYGDWLAPGDPTYLPFIDQCFWAYSTQLVINAAKVLNKSDDIDKYTSLLEKIRSAFLKEYIEADGRTISNTQTSYVLALQFGMLPDSLQKPAAEKLVALIRANNNHLSTGFLGTPYLLHVLTNYGYTDLAYDLLNQETYPSWLYPVKMGATTIWERWDGIQPDETPLATSFNHYSYGAVGDWLYRVVAGIDALEPGYKKIKIAPHIGGGLTWVKATYKCKYGIIVAEWKIDPSTGSGPSTDSGSKIKMHVEIPPHTTAIIYPPGKDSIEVRAGSYDF